jgi:hypothetical protein
LAFGELIDVVDCEFKDGASINTEDNLDIYQGSRGVWRTKIDEIGFLEVKCEFGGHWRLCKGKKSLQIYCQPAT